MESDNARERRYFRGRFLSFCLPLKFFIFKIKKKFIFIIYFTLFSLPFKFLISFIFFFLAVLHGFRDLSSLTRNRTQAHENENHWTIREFPGSTFKKNHLFIMENFKAYLKGDRITITHHPVSTIVNSRPVLFHLSPCISCPISALF